MSDNSKITCPDCGGSGEHDSGGFSERGYPISVPCPTCEGHGKIVDEVAMLRDRLAASEASRERLLAAAKECSESLEFALHNLVWRPNYRGRERALASLTLIEAAIAASSSPTPTAPPTTPPAP